MVRATSENPDDVVESGPPARIRLLGEVLIERPDHTEVRLTSLDAALLAKLALDGPQSRIAMGGLLWPEASADRALTNLRQRLYRLNRATGLRLVNLGKRLQLHPKVVVDAADPGSLDQKALLAAGTLLPGVDLRDHVELHHWLEGARAHWLEVLAHALTGLAEALEQGGRLSEALPVARRLVDLEPRAEQGWRRLMRLYHLRNDRAAAQEAFWSMSSLLRDAGLRPSPETLELMRTIEAVKGGNASSQAVSASLLRPPTLVDVRLRGLPSGARDLLRIAAVAGADMSVELAAQILERPVKELADDWAELQTSGAFLGDAISHYLMVEAALNDTPDGVRMALHEQVAKLLAAQSEANPARTAWHWEQASRWLQAARSYEAAAEAASRAGRMSEVVALSQQAAHCRSIAKINTETDQTKRIRETVVHVSTVAPARLTSHLLPDWSRDALLSEWVRVRVEVTAGTSIEETAAHLVERSCAPISVRPTASVAGLFEDDELALVGVFPSGAVRTVGSVRIAPDGNVSLAPFSYWDLLDPDDPSDLIEGGSITQQVDLVVVAIAA